MANSAIQQSSRRYHLHGSQKFLVCRISTTLEEGYNFSIIHHSLKLCIFQEDSSPCAKLYHQLIIMSGLGGNFSKVEKKNKILEHWYIFFQTRINIMVHCTLVIEWLDWEAVSSSFWHSLLGLFCLIQSHLWQENSGKSLVLSFA